MPKAVAVSLVLTGFLAVVGSLALIDLLVFYAVAGGLILVAEGVALLLPRGEDGRRPHKRGAGG